MLDQGTVVLADIFRLEIILFINEYFSMPII